MNKNFSLAALTLSTFALANTLFATPAKAVQADVEIRANIPEVVFLETYESLTYDVSVEDLGTDTAPIQTVAGTFDSTGVVEELLEDGVNGTLATSKAISDVIVYKTWGLGGPTGNITHGTEYNDTPLTQTEGTSEVAVTVAPTTTTTTTAPGLSYASAITGTVDFTFDFTKTTRSGLHTGGVLTVTATAE